MGKTKELSDYDALAVDVNYLIGVIEASISDPEVRERCLDTVFEMGEHAGLHTLS